MIDLEREIDLIAPLAPQKWFRLAVTDDMSEAAKKQVVRLNCFGSLFYFNKVALGHTRLAALHEIICSELENDSVRLSLEVPRDMFKALDISTLIPTPTGMRLMRDIQVGDYVLGADGLPTRITGVSEISYRPVYDVVFSSGESIRCDADHLWETHSRYDRDANKPPKVRTTAEISQTLKCRKENNHRVTVSSASVGRSNINIPPYTLGAWLGDGTSASGQITCDDPEIIENIRKEGFIVNKQKAPFMYGILGLVGLLRKEGLLGNKHIPASYLSCSIEQRWELLRGLMDTDGTADKKWGYCRFSNTHLELVKQVRQLICSLGIKPNSIGTYTAKLNGKSVGNFYVLPFCCYIDKSPFRLSRKTARLPKLKKGSRQGFRQIVDVSPAGMAFVKCIQVDSPHMLYLAGEGYIPTHNTTCTSVGGSMWWALPFNDTDEEYMRKLGYGDAWIRWMRRAHCVSTRTLIASEVLGNARKIGVRISGHYESNALFRYLFPEIIPTRSDRWNQDSMTHVRTDYVHHGEGTYDLIGAKGALQSRHYDRQILDDLVGEKAINSDLVMQGTIEWVKKLPGAFDTDPLNPDRLCDQLFIGNRWSERDLGSWLRKQGLNMRFVTHSAEGGCCPLHPGGVPIFPEEFPLSKLADLRKIWGPYHYAAQYLNNPIDPEAVRFKSQWLRHYTISPWTEPRPAERAANEYAGGVYVCNHQQLGNVEEATERALWEDRRQLEGYVPNRLKVGIYHDAQDGEVIEDIRAGQLHRVAILDPNHSQDKGRSRHAIVVLGYWVVNNHPQRIYLLDCWAEACSFDRMISKLIGTKEGNLGLAFKWKVHHIYLESDVAGQQGWDYFFRAEVKRMGPAASFTVRPLKTDRSAGGKEKRIIGMEPIYENGIFWVPRTGGGVEQFLGEYESYPNGNTKDILDVIGYAPQTFGQGSGVKLNTRDMAEAEIKRRRQMTGSMGVAGY